MHFLAMFAITIFVCCLFLLLGLASMVQNQSTDSPYVAPIFTGYDTESVRTTSLGEPNAGFAAFGRPHHGLLLKWVQPAKAN
jgi:hypothetical protein